MAPPSRGCGGDELDARDGRPNHGPSRTREDPVPVPQSRRRVAVSRWPFARRWALAATALLAAGAAPLAAQATVSSGAAGRAAADGGPPDLVLLGGRVFTADPARPWAEAIAVRGPRVVAVGTTAEVARLAGPRTRRVALGGRTVVPGFNDAHAHVEGFAPPGVTVRVDTAALPDPALAPVLDSLAAAARRAPPDTWLVGVVGGRVFDDPRATRAVLDSVAPRHRVWLAGAGAAGAVLNTAGLRAAGLLDAPDAPGGTLTRDADGRPTGRADGYVLLAARRRLAGAAGDGARVAARRDEEAASVRLGLTTVQEMATGLDLATARRLYARERAGPPLGTAGPRRRLVPAPLPGAPSGWRADAETTIGGGALAPRVGVSGVKWILDGTPIERGALLREPYADRPGWYGRATFPFDTLRAILREALRRKQQPVLHAVGDSAIALVIAAMRAEAPDSVWRRLRPRLEHADLLGRDQVPALRALGVVVVQNPAHLATVALSRARFGAERVARTGLLRTLVDSGVPLALGSDGPRAPGLNVLLASRHPNVPGEALTREQAVVAYTRGSAYAEGAERETGTLAPGMRADLVVLSADVFTAPPPVLPAIASVLTVIDGRVAHDDGSLAPGAAAEDAPPGPTTGGATRSVAFVNGQWFTGAGFAARTVYSVGGRFTSTPPARIDTTVDLTGTWVVPPFGEAHNHNVDGAVEGRTRAALARYVADGVFYVQIQGNFPVGDALRQRLPMNRPDGPDVALAQAFVTASGGHPIPLHETVLLPQGYYPGFTRERLRDSLYVTLDSAADLERQWPRIRALRPDFIKAILWGSAEHARRRDDAAYVGRRGLDPQLLPDLVARAHRDGLRVSAHVNDAADFHHAVAAGVDMIAHGGSPSFFNTVEDRAADPAALRDPAGLQRALLDALRAPAGTGRGYVPIAEADAREAARRGIAVVTTVALLTRAPEPARAALRPYVAASLGRLRDAGVTLVVGSDNPTDTAVLEFEQLAALGVWDNLGLLKLWSEATPRAIFPGRRIGALADGYEASFLALGGNPLTDIANVRRIRLRFKQGVLLGQ